MPPGSDRRQQNGVQAVESATNKPMTDDKQVRRAGRGICNIIPRQLTEAVPADLFTMIDFIIKRTPSRLSQHHWHSREDGTEARLPVDVLSRTSTHCLFGWVVALTPGAVEWAWSVDPEMDTMEFANALLVGAGRLRLPAALQFEDEASAAIVIAGRAAEELQMKSAQSATGVA